MLMCTLSWRSGGRRGLAQEDAAFQGLFYHLHNHGQICSGQALIWQHISRQTEGQVVNVQAQRMPRSACNASVRSLRLGTASPHTSLHFVVPGWWGGASAEAW